MNDIANIKCSRKLKFLSLVQEHDADSTVPGHLLSAAVNQLYIMTDQLEGSEGALYHEPCMKDALGCSILGEAL